MSFGQIVQIAECLVVIYCGIKLSVGNEPMRWNKKWVKGLYIILVSMEAGLQVANTFYFKFSEVGVLIHSVYIFILLYIFYYINFWILFAQNFLFWQTYVLMRYIILYIGCFINKVPVYKYVKLLYNEPWQILHIISMIVTIIFSVELCRRLKGKFLIKCKWKQSYIVISILAVIEEMVSFILFNKYMLHTNIKDVHIFIIIFVFWSFLCSILLVIVLKAYIDEIHQKHISELNYEHLKRYYRQLQGIYKEKKIEMHDVEELDNMLINMLEQGRNTEVIQYLNDKKQLAIIGQKNKYTGMDIIDLILDCKIKEARQNNIDVVLDIDAVFCPLEPTDLCVILGNLFDNAIEATKDLPIEKRIIKVKMLTPNSVFILEVSNRYEGHRKKIDGHYRTTKTGIKVCGLGLDSVEWILKQYGGWLDIEDENNRFVVVVSLFLKQGQI